MQIIKETLAPTAPILLINHINFKTNFTEILQALNFQSELKFFKNFSKENLEIYLKKRLKICIKLFENLSEPELFKPVLYNFALIVACFEFFKIKLDFENLNESYSFQSVIIHRVNSCLLSNLKESGMMTQLLGDVLTYLIFEKKWKNLRKGKLSEISFELNPVDPWKELVLVFHARSNEFEFFLNKFSRRFLFFKYENQVNILEKFPPCSVRIMKEKSLVFEEEGVEESVIRINRKYFILIKLRVDDQEIEVDFLDSKSGKKLKKIKKKILGLNRRINNVRGIRLYGSKIYYNRMFLFDLKTTFLTKKLKKMDNRFKEFSIDQYVFRFFFNAVNFDICFLDFSYPLKPSLILSLSKKNNFSE